MTAIAHPRLAPLPRIGFLGVGWIGRHRMERIAESGCAKVAGLADTSIEVATAASQAIGDTQVVSSLDELLDMDLDGLVIATPSALHAEQAIRALERGVAVFCQKPLGRSAAETRAVVSAARHNNRLLGVDFSYRAVRGVSAIRELVQRGALGQVFAVNLVFHNAYGPDKAWFYDAALSGGGCLIDLGIHLIDLALWALGWPQVVRASGNCFALGQPLKDHGRTVEDYATGRIELEQGTLIDIACSWRASAGRDAVIEASFFGTEGGAALKNSNGSFYDFVVERYTGTSRQTLASPPDAWGGRTATAWASRLRESASFDPTIEHAIQVAEIVDAMYGRT